MPKRQRERFALQVPAFVGSLFLVASMIAAVGFSMRWVGAAGSPTVAVTLDKSSLTAGTTATVTFTFSTQPVGFSNDDVDLSDAHGTLSTVTPDALDPTVYTATFIPDSGVVAPNSTIGVGVNWTDTSLQAPDVASVSASTFYPSTAAGPAGIAFDGSDTWTANRDDDSVTRVKPAGTMSTYKVTGVMPVAIAFDGTNMWTADQTSNTVTKIAPDGTGTQIALAAGAKPVGIVFGNDAVWTANQGDGSVTRISTGTGTVFTYAGVGAGPSAISFDGTNAWVAMRGTNSVAKIDPAGTVTAYAGTGSNPVAIAFDGTNMWTANVGDNSVTRISPAGAMVSYNGVGAGPVAIAFDGTNMWTANATGSSVSKITAAGTVTTYSGAGAGPAGIVFAGSRPWLTNNDATANGVTKFGVEHAAVSAAFGVSTLGGSGCATPAVKLIAPNGGEVLAAGSDVDVFWSSSGCQVSALSLLLSDDSGATWPTTVMTTALPTSGYYRWTVPQTGSNAMRLRADLLGQGGTMLASDVSDGTFTVQAPGAPPDGGGTTPPPAGGGASVPPPAPPPPGTTPDDKAVTFPAPAAPPSPNVPAPILKTTPLVVDDQTAQPRTPPAPSEKPTETSPPLPSPATPPPAQPEAQTVNQPPMPISLDNVQQAVDAVSTAAPASWSSAISFAEGALAMLGVLFGAQHFLKRRGAGSNLQSCSHCHGTGKEPKKNVALGTCEDCEGSGMTEEEDEQTVECKHCEGEGEDPCHFCKGEGKDEKGNTCEHCEGEGVTPSGKKDKNGKDKPKRCCKCLGKGELDVNIKKKSPCKTCGGTGKA